MTWHEKLKRSLRISSSVLLLKSNEEVNCRRLPLNKTGTLFDSSLSNPFHSMLPMGPNTWRADLTLGGELEEAFIAGAAIKRPSNFTLISKPC